MNLINKSFKDNKTGEIIRIVDSYQNIAITDSKEKIDARRLTDTNFYSEYIDPKSFFNDPNTYSLFAEKIKSVDLSKVPEDGTRGGVIDVQATSYSGLNPQTNESAVVAYDPEEEMEELKRKYGATVDTNALNKQNDAFARLLGDEQPTQSVQQPQQPPVRQTQVYQEPDQPVQVQRIEVEDPIITMFKNVKKNVDFSIDLKVEGKIPRLDFIEMMEDSYEISMIEYLADEFTKKVLSDSNFIRNKIIDEIKSKVYKNKPKEEVNKPILEESKPVVKKTRGSKKQVQKDDTGTISEKSS
jgi:hypothetical protein